MKLDVDPGRTARARPTRTPAASRSTRACRPSSSSTARCTTTASGRWLRAGSRTTASPSLAPDLPGHGRSGGAAARERRGDRRLAARARSTRPASGRFAVVGHSMGSLIALEAAAARRRAGRAPRPRRDGVPDARLAGAARRGADGSDGGDRQRQRLLAFEPRRQALVSRPGHLAARREPRPHAADAGGADRRQSVPHRLHGLRSLSRREAAAERVRCPTTMVLGERDQMTFPRRGARPRQATRRANRHARRRPRHR